VEAGTASLNTPASTAIDSPHRYDDDRAMTRQEALPLRCALGALALVAVLAQFVVVPQMAADYAGAYPEVAYLASPYVTAIVIAIGAFEVALLAAWQLLSAAVSGAVSGAGGPSTSRPTRWANVLAASLAFMAVLIAGVCVHAGSFAAVGGPAMLFGLIACLALVPAAFVLRNRAMGPYRI
jgi:hypothetical protein